MTVNRGPRARVELIEMIRNGALALLGMLLLATPASAAGEKFFAPPQFVATSAPRPITTPVLPASSPFVVATRPFAASNSVASPLPVTVQPVPDRRHHRQPITFVGVGAPAPQVIVVQQPVYYADVSAAPSQCATQGYWSYRWIPYTTTQTLWVQGSWAADGTWLESHYESRPYSSGYYEPFWTPGQSYAC